MPRPERLNGFATWINGPHGLEERLNSQRFPWEANSKGLPVVPDHPVGQAVTPLPTPIAAGNLCFVSQDTGWIVNTSLFLGNGPPPQPAPTTLYATTDAGAAWQLVAGHELSGGVGPEPGPYPGALSVVSADAAYLTGSCGACYPSSPTTPPAVALGGTTDAGYTWEDFPVPGLPLTATAITFATANQGWLVAEGNAAPPPQILATTDGGRTWATQLTLDPAPQ